MVYVATGYMTTVFAGCEDIQIFRKERNANEKFAAAATFKKIAKTVNDCSQVQRWHRNDNN